MRRENRALASVALSSIVALVSGCGANPAVVQQLADLMVASSHSGSFQQGQQNSYNITVTNVGNAATSGTVTVVDTLPAGFTAAAISGNGWTCTLNNLTCTRSDALSANASYPAINLTVNVAANASPASVANVATVSGGGDQNSGNNTANDATTLTCTNSLVSICGLFTFMMEGFDKNGSYKMAGIFTADGFGNVTGTFDEVRVGAANGPVAIQAGSNYSLGGDGRGPMNLTTPLGARAFKIANMSSSSTGFLIESDPASGIHASGFYGSTGATFSASSLTFSYAVVVIGETSDGKRIGMLGTMAGDGNCGLNSNPGTVTINNAGTVTSSLSFTGTCNGSSGSTIDPTTGRGIASLTFSSGPFAGTTIQFVFYMQSDGRVMAFIEKNAPTATVPTFSGFVRRQIGIFDFSCGVNATDLACAVVGWGKTAAGDSDVFLGRAVKQANGTFTLTYDQNNGGAITSNNTTTGFTYNITTQRTGTITPPGGSTVPTIDFVQFQTDAAYTLARDASVSRGYILGQGATTFTGTPLTLIPTLNAGPFIQHGPPSAAVIEDAIGRVTVSAASTGAFSGTWDAATATGFSSAAASGSYVIDPATGRGSGTLNLPGDPLGANSSMVLYTVDGSACWLMENDTGVNSARLWFFSAP